MSKRTQITLTDRQHRLLVDEAYRSGLTMAELVRRAVDATYRPHSRLTVKGFELIAGLWRQPDVAVIGRRVLPKRVVDR